MPGVPMQNWLLKLRRQGIAVLLIHHAGTNGRQRRTSRREDALDTVIALRRPDDYSPEQGARFEVHFENCEIGLMQMLRFRSKRSLKRFRWTKPMPFDGAIATCVHRF